MISTTKMSDLNIGDTACVTELNLPTDIKKRLKEFGLIENTCVECVLRTHRGDMAAFIIRGACIALRDTDSMQIICESKSAE